MSTFHTEGLIKEVAINGAKVTFKLEPSAPYVFEKKKDDGSTEKCLLFVDGDKKNICQGDTDIVDSYAAYVSQSKVEFEAKKGYVQSLLFAKSNRMRIRVEVCDSHFSDKFPIKVGSIVVL